MFLVAGMLSCSGRAGLYETRFEPAGNSGGYPSLILAGRPWPAPREKATPWTSCPPLPFNPFRTTPAAARLLLSCVVSFVVPVRTWGL